MLGFEGAGVYLAYVFCILATALCVVYGIANWNRPREDEAPEVNEEIKWELKEDEITKKQ